jgi:hypothetical protein
VKYSSEERDFARQAIAIPRLRGPSKLSCHADDTAVPMRHGELFNHQYHSVFRSILYFAASIGLIMPGNTDDTSVCCKYRAGIVSS